MAIFVKHTGCPRCGSSDALAHYSDGGLYCFSCGNAGGATVPSFREETDEYDEDAIVLPNDLDHNFPQEVVEWIKPTSLKIEELIAHGYFFSKSSNRLVRLLQSSLSERTRSGVRRSFDAAESRYHYVAGTKSTNKSKFHGSKENIYAYSFNGQSYNPLQPSTTSTSSQAHPGQGKEADGKLHCYGRHPRKLVIVEDSLSSMKIGRFLPSAPLFGSSIGKDKLTRLVKPFDEAIVWLDSNKLDVARKIAEQIALLGKKSRVIFTELDPKYCEPQDYV